MMPTMACNNIALGSPSEMHYQSEYQSEDISQQGAGHLDLTYGDFEQYDVSDLFLGNDNSTVVAPLTRSNSAQEQGPNPAENGDMLSPSVESSIWNDDDDADVSWSHFDYAEIQKDNKVRFCLCCSPYVTLTNQCILKPP